MAENETIAQVETDKVTIDIKAPSEGTILGVVVQEQDTVVPGQLVATLDDAVAKVGAAAGSHPENRSGGMLQHKTQLSDVDDVLPAGQACGQQQPHPTTTCS